MMFLQNQGINLYNFIPDGNIFPAQMKKKSKTKTTTKTSKAKKKTKTKTKMYEDDLNKGTNCIYNSNFPNVTQTDIYLPNAFVVHKKTIQPTTTQLQCIFHILLPINSKSNKKKRKQKQIENTIHTVYKSDIKEIMQTKKTHILHTTKPSGKETHI